MNNLSTSGSFTLSRLCHSYVANHVVTSRDAMEDKKLKIAVLGPLGTYTHEASVFTIAS
jgi:hypothetical protein